MSSLRVEILQDLIPKLQGIKEVLEKELHYDWSVTDEVQNIIDALEYDLGEQEERESDK